MNNAIEFKAMVLYDRDQTKDKFTVRAYYCQVTKNFWATSSIPSTPSVDLNLVLHAYMKLDMNPYDLFS